MRLAKLITIAIFFLAIGLPLEGNANDIANEEDKTPPIGKYSASAWNLNWLLKHRYENLVDPLCIRKEMIKPGGHFSELRLAGYTLTGIEIRLRYTDELGHHILVAMDFVDPQDQRGIGWGMIATCPLK